jgi:DNA-binding transcriptional LysR family regulator
MNIRDVDLNLLVVLDTMLRTQHVSRAAEALGMSQPALSAALNRLRALFGDPLFVRSSRGMQPTPRARQVAQPLRSIIETIQAEVLQHSRFDPSTAQRVVTINMSDVGELVFLPALLAHLKQVAPAIDLKTVSTPSPDLEDALRSGEVDLAVGYFPGIDSAVVYEERLFSHRFVCVIREGHPDIGRQMTRAQFLAAEHAVVHPEGKSHERFEQALIAQGLTRRVRVGLPHYLAIPTLLAESDLVVTVPYAVGIAFLKMGKVRMIDPPIRVRPVEVRQIWHARYQQDAMNVWLRGVVKHLFSDGHPRRARGEAR